MVQVYIITAQVTLAIRSGFTALPQSSLSLRENQEMLLFWESSESSSESSDGEFSEDDILDEDTKLRKGAVVKQGFLMKKVRL